VTSPVRVLQVDGDPSFRAAVAAGLGAPGQRVDVTTAGDTDAALEHLRGSDVDCLLTEASPPGSDRLDLVSHAASERPDLAVVVVADAVDGSLAADALAAGADDVVPRASSDGALSLVADRVARAAGREREGEAGGSGRAEGAERGTGDATRGTGTDDATRGTGTSDAVEGLADPAPVGVWILREDTVAYANPACAELFGYGASELAGTQVGDLVAEDDRATVEEHVQSLLDGGQAQRTDDVVGVGRWNERRRLEVRGRRVETDRGPAVLGALVDVTDERRCQRRLATLFGEFDQPMATVALADGQAVVRDVNPAFEATFGVDAAALADEPLADHVVPDGDPYEAALDVYLRLERGESVTERVTRVTGDGLREFRLQALPFDDAGAPRADLVYTDVADRTRRERSLTELQSVARELLAADGRGEVARVGVDAAERVLDVDVACLFGVEDDRLVPMAATDAAEALFDGVPTIPEGGGAAWYVHEMDDRLVTDDVRSMGTVANPDTDVRSELLVPVGDHAVFVASATEVGVFDDTDAALAETLASALEAALERAERETLLRERERELLRQNERLEEFAGIVSHDLRSPLTVVKGNVDLLRREGDPEYLERIETAVDRMDELIEDLLALAREGQAVEDADYVALEDVVDHAWATADTRGAMLLADLDVAVEADRGRLRQLLENLFNNAVEHGGDGVTVRVGTIVADVDDRTGGQYGRDVRGFYVADDGEGLPDLGEELTEPGTTTDDEGTGFGLAIVDRIAEAHGWTLRTTESEAGGARFEFVDVDAA
jgi:PAS domain S-box-containing protein